MAANNAYPISSNSRTKLNAFRFQKGELVSNDATSKDVTELADGSKKHKNLSTNEVVEPMQVSSDKGCPPLRAAKAPEPQIQESKPIEECPQTPGNRIPLADLISNAEDSFDPTPGPEVTPVEHVIWQHVPASSNPDTSSQTPAGRRRKRRHSSSPAGSPTNGNKKKVLKEALDLHSMQALFKTPQHDMAAELWNNYMDKNMVDGPDDLPPPRFANLFSSSPQTPGSGRKSRDSSGLRRAISCTTDFPTSRTKRRRVNRLDVGLSRGIQRTSSNVESGRPKSSRINYLMEKIEKSIHMAPADAGLPGSSPLRQHMDARRCRSSSPTKHNKLHEADEETTKSPCAFQFEKAKPGQLPVLQESSSEFGDDDLDQGLMDLADASEDPFIGPANLSNEFASLGSSGWAALVAEKSRPWQPKKISIPDSKSSISIPHDTTTNETKRDEFDDFEDEYDDLPDNLQEILAKCDTNPVSVNFSKPTTTVPPLQKLDATNVTVNGSMHSKPLTAASVKPEVVSSDDEFDDDFDLEAIEQTMKQAGEGRPAYNLKDRQAIKRYQIVNITKSTYVTPKGRTQPEQELLVEDEKTQDRKVIVLRESWFDTPCSTDSFIHLVGDFNSAGQCVVDNLNHMIILHPDHLISATVVADSMDCQRRAVLQDRVKVIAALERPQAFGVFFHEVFQEALKANQWDMESLKTLVETVMGRHIEELYSIQMSIPEAVEYLMSRMPAVLDWADAFLHLKPQAKSMVEDRNNTKLNLSINKLLEVEEHIWSPMYGLKGNIDATVQVTCHEDKMEKNLVVPLELKTGRRDTNQSHRAQTALYTLLLSDRYDIDVTFGLLYYLELTKTLSIRGIRHELLQMIQVRNHLAGYIRERQQLPPMLKKARQCIRCYAKTPCLIYHKLSEDGNGETSALGEDFDAAVGHLNNGDRDFFRKWDELLTKEEGNLVKFRRELWTLLSSEREALGRCFGDVVIDPHSVYEENTGTKINRYHYTFVKRQALPDFSFAESQISVGEPIVISDEKGHFALANGYVVHVSSSHIQVGVDRKLHNARSKTAGFDAVTNQSFRGIMEVGKEEPAALETPDEQLVYRIDKDEFSNGMAIVRNNLICMMDKDLFQARQLRRLIVKGQAPAFKTTSSSHNISDPDNLNVDQRQAIDKVMSAKDYALVLGMPGTGKTTTIAHIIRALVAQGKSVLLTSYTHTAVDNILLKIRDDKIHVLRIGATAKVHPDVQEFADLAAIPKATIEELRDSYEKPQVVATTCLGVNHNIFNQRIFDYCIVDEASQITLPVCLGPIRMARTFILVGDHYQLPPLVQNKAAQEGGLDISLFKLLSDAQPDSVVNLEHQYRMCEDIMLLSNTLIYSGRLKCGTPQVAARSLDIPNINALGKFHVEDLAHSQSQSQREICPGTPTSPCWLRDLLEPFSKTRLVNTDPIGPAALEIAQGNRVVNHMEVFLCSQLVDSFIACGIPARNIGVITFYRSQLSLLRQSLRRYTPDLEMHTTDKFQGRDKEVIILSCVRSNAENNVGELLRDWRRVNVAFTRAQTKLLVVGSRSTLRDGNELLCKYVRLVESKGWVYNLPSGAIDKHFFPSCATQSQLVSPGTALASGSAKDKGKGKNESPSSRITREPLSPLGSRQPAPGRRKPSKTGAKLFNGTDVVGNRPILRDIVNDLTG
ncbi:DNA replication helicase Dna2, putative [Penicillium digitatum]|uniref:DNA replication ATP-dependent helicase/nuclease n=1 Tax=Penicillium digitatum TaxID=36651 RepID=A0A7T7BNB9_PENDI|nr:DNA replication helicase Dna2, putative [Penicillium digitatum]